ncbi:hypothetical protein WA026_000303 [Henosepilachna vigintioctopunctata]|uniref:DNA mismatch repair proteins mutS family domain-containing protein n=1 Tax=Henosepilachna vigintioctopunctata TaxID=420089 RepID=A0AAW1UY22_9CUCU
MNLTEKVNRDKLKPVLIHDRSRKCVQKPFISFHPKQRNRRNKKDSTPSSKINWGQSCQSVTSSCGVNTESSSKENARIVIALSEGRGEARCEVGIAVINVSQPHLILCQISDTQSYDNTLRKINIFNPTQILVPMTFVDSATQSRLIEKVKEQFPLINCTAVKRNTYNKASGMEYVQELCVPSLNSVLLVLQHRYYALTAASALLKFLQNNLNIFYAGGSIKIDYQESEGYAIIDISTADRLELVSSTRPFQASKYSTLFGVLNGCYTRIGERALRTLLLQPPYDISIILERQTAVTALVKQPEKLQAIQAMLQKIGNIDQLLVLSTIVVDDSQYWSERQLNYMLYLNGVADLIMTLSEVVIDMNESIFTSFCDTLKSQDFLKIRDTVRTLIHENAYCAKSQNGLTQRCFAIKPGINGLLDLVRKIYSERLDDMREYVKVLGEKYDLPLILGNNASKGYHIVLTLNKHQKMTMKKSDLPKEFIQVCRLAGSYTMKTMEIINFQTRVDDIVADIMKISNVMIFKTLSSFKKYMGIFYKLCEHISNIDVIQSLATVSVRNNYVKPTFGEYTEVKESQHPMLDMLADEKPVPNLISSCENYNIHIITGPNGSGKSIFIRQVMLLQIIAQIGGYVPASSAIFRPADRLFARIYLDDNMECGASSFVLEIKEIIYILSHITNNSLVIMDELGRSTSLEEGSALAMTVCERLADSSAFVYLTSHFTLVTKLADLYLNVKNWHMDTEATGNTPRTLNLEYKYSLKKGVTTLKRYGIFMVKTLWPADILEDVYKMLEKSSDPLQEIHTQKISQSIRRKYQLESNLRKLKSKGKLKISEVEKLINQYRNDLVSQNIYLENINLGKSVEQYQPNIFSKQYSDPSSDEVLNDAADSILNSTSTSQHGFQMPINNTEDFRNSSYELLSQFIEEDSRNLNLLKPDIHISFADSNPNGTMEEETDSTNQKFLATVHKENKTEKVNILSNILLNENTMNDKASVDDVLEEDYFQMEDYNYNYPSQEVSKNSQQSDKVQSTNWSLLIESQMLMKNISNQMKDTSVENSIENNLYTFGDYEGNLKNFNSQNTIEESNMFKIPRSSFHFGDNSINDNQNAEFQFLKPTVSPIKVLSAQRSTDKGQSNANKSNTKKFHFSLPSLRNQTTHLTDNFQSIDSEDNINQFHFSLPLLRNQSRTSTPIRPFKENVVEDSILDIKSSSNLCPNKHFYKSDVVSFGVSQESEYTFPKEKTYATHIYPKIKVIEGPNNLSISFGEEDKKSRNLPLPQANELDDVVKDNYIDEENPGFEEFVKEEVKLFLSQSADLFEGDVNSLDITIENYQKSKSSQKIAPDSMDIIDSSKRDEVHINDSLDSYNNVKEIKHCDIDRKLNCNIENNFYPTENSPNILINYDIENDVTVLPVDQSEGNKYFEKSDIRYPNVAKSKLTPFPVQKTILSECIDKKDKVSTTSISEASRIRNLDRSSSGRSSDSKRQSKSSKKIGTTTTDISSASRERNLSSDIRKNVSSSTKSLSGEEITEELPDSCSNNHNISSSVNISRLVVDKQHNSMYKTGEFSMSSSRNYQTVGENFAVLNESKNSDGSSSDKLEKNLDEPSKILFSKDEQGTSDENSNYRSVNEDSDNVYSELVSKRDEETKISKKSLGYTRRSLYGSTVSNKRSLGSDSNDTSGSKKRKSIVGPFKLTKNEIQEEFNKQDEILLQGDMDVSTYSKYLNQRMNRPSVRQIQNAEHIATIRKTDNGTLILPAKKCASKSRKNVEKSAIAEKRNCFDLSIFSDQNANKMSAFLASNERNYNQFKFDEEREVSFSNLSFGFASQVTRKQKFGRSRSMGGFQFQDFTKITQNNSFILDSEFNSSILLRQSQRSRSSSFYIPDGYFKTNKKEIEDICSKYLARSDFLMYKAKTSPI